MGTRVHTGGEKEFYYTGEEDLLDTDSTKEFKESYKKWMIQPKWKRWLKRLFRIVK